MAEAEESLFLSEGEEDNNDEQQVSGNKSAPASTNFFDESIEGGNRAYENALYYKPSEEKPKPYPRADRVLNHTQVSNAPYVSPYADDGPESGYGRMTRDDRGARLLRRRLDELEGIGRWDKPAFQRRFEDLEIKYENERKKTRELHWAVRGVGVHSHEAVVEEVKQLVKNRNQLAEETGEERDGTRDVQLDPKRRRV
ncbi:MAG: hypothetical protein Q9184_005389 [Pyrenodesmia sp. 2 TL-2023]